MTDAEELESTGSMERHDITFEQLWDQVWTHRAYVQLIVTDYVDREETTHVMVVGVPFGHEPVVVEHGVFNYAVSKVVIERDVARVYGRRRARRGQLRYAERFLMEGPAPLVPKPV